MLKKLSGLQTALLVTKCVLESEVLNLNSTVKFPSPKFPNVLPIVTISSVSNCNDAPGGKATTVTVIAVLVLSQPFTV